MNAPALTTLITGAGSGLGRGLALALAQAGHRIVATDLNLDAAHETGALIRGFGGQATGYALDVASPESLAALMREVEGRIDVLINNAGLQHVARVEEFPIDQWQLLMRVMLDGTFLMTRAVIPRMRAHGFGRIINIGSIHSVVASPFKAAYVAAKHALIGFTKTVALETADADITINAICPSYIRTPLVDKQIASQAAARGIPENAVIENVMLGPMPKKVFITCEEVAGAAQFLISSAARNVTGQALCIDGGWSIQ